MDLAAMSRQEFDMTRRITISLTVIFGILMLLSAAEAEGDRVVIAKAEQISDDRFTLTTSTPKGATVYAIDQPSQAVLTAIDTGLTDLFAVARKNGYRKYLDYSDYTIFIARPDRLRTAPANIHQILPSGQVNMPAVFTTKVDISTPREW